MATFHHRAFVAAAVSLAVALTGCSSSDPDDPVDTASEVDASIDSVADPGDDTVVTDLDENPVENPVVLDPADNLLEDPVDNTVDDSVDSPVTDPDDAPVAMEPVDAEPDPAPAVVISLTPFELLADLPFDADVFTEGNSITPFAIAADGSRVLVKEGFSDTSDNFVNHFLSYDVQADSAELLPFSAIDDAFPAFDEAWTTMAYATPCTTTIQLLGSVSEPLTLGADLDDVCSSLQSAQISDDGETVLMPSFTVDGSSSVPVILGVSSGSVMTLDNETLQQADAALEGRTSTALNPSLSADGRYVVATVFVSDDPAVLDGQQLVFSAGTVIADTRSGDLRVVGLSDYERFACERCTVIPVVEPAISGNGQYLIYAQAPEFQTPGETAEVDSLLFRYNIDTGVSQQFWSGPVGASEVVISDDGTRAAFRTAGDIQVVYFGSDEIISLQDSFRFCDEEGNECQFDSARFVTSTVLEMSGDGSALSVYLVLVQPTGSSSGDTSELIHFDMNSGVLRRVAPGSSGSFTHLSDDGNFVTLIGTDNRGEDTIAVLRSGDDQ